MTTTCPACGQASSGHFCSQCGTDLESPRRCPKCDHELPPGGRFCHMCGTPATSLSAASAYNQPEPEARDAASSLPWIITAGVLAALVVALLIPRFRDQGPAASPVASGPPITGTPGGPAAVDLASMTPREAADRLFNRVMQSISSGDSAQARQFLPMALMAYQRIPDLDLDGLYHLGLLQLVSGDPQAARASAERILDEAPSHLFGLFTAAQAERALGNEEESRELFRRFLQHYDAEAASDRPEYREHANMLPILREEAQRAVGEA